MDVIRWFPLHQYDRLQDALTVELSRPQRVRVRDAIGVALGLHGMRVGEVVRARRSELHVAGAVLHVPPFKRCRARRLRLHGSLVEAIRRHWSTRPAPSKYLLANCRGGPIRHQQYQRAAERLFRQLLGDDHGLTFHSLRHTFAMRLYSETRDIRLVQRLLGHRCVASTEIYADSLSDLPDHLLLAVDSAPRAVTTAAAASVPPPPGASPLRVVHWPE